MEMTKPKDPMKALQSFMSKTGTAVFGFFLALMMNSLVNKVNAIHQRHALVDSMREESEKNIVIANANYRFYDSYMHWADNMEDRVQAQLDHPQKGPLPLSFPPDWDPSDLLDINRAGDMSPTSSVYSASKDSGLFSVLTPEESRVYARAYHQHDNMSLARAKFLDTVEKRQQFECNFSPATPPCAPYLSKMNKDDLKQYNLLLAQTELAAYNMQMTLDHVYGAHTAIMNGAKTEDDVMHGIRQAMVDHHRVPARPAVEDLTAD
jgi:hypothetical protein